MEYTGYDMWREYVMKYGVVAAADYDNLPDISDSPSPYALATRR